jgi:hypothetical protein
MLKVEGLKNSVSAISWSSTQFMYCMWCESLPLKFMNKYEFGCTAKTGITFTTNLQKFLSSSYCSLQLCCPTEGAGTGCPNSQHCMHYVEEIAPPALAACHKPFPTPRCLDLVARHKYLLMGTHDINKYTGIFIEQRIRCNPT